MPRQILIITGDAGESFETLYARQRLIEAGFVPRIAAPSKRRLHLVIHDFEPGWDTYIEKPGYLVASDPCRGITVSESAWYAPASPTSP